ncbi:uncharacterized protein OCT59_029025 [Rhizophagus irregularis]|uniref:uncharacterized protein n=1 Tax=Rhizophagus irregularis TaxID=588596 RepID=UPI00332F9A0F|nr:hypothetical protein OCT59_029025 [Rhizophagus irregularis]
MGLPSILSSSCIGNISPTKFNNNSYELLLYSSSYIKILYIIDQEIFFIGDLLVLLFIMIANSKVIYLMWKILPRSTCEKQDIKHIGVYGSSANFPKK